MSTHTRVSVIVAAVDAQATVAASLGRFAEQVCGRGEVLLVDGSSDRTALVAQGLALPGVRVLQRPVGLLVPDLWRAGLDATDAPLVALSTAQMVADRGWLEALRARLDETGAAAVGGPIEPAEGLSPLDRAVYLLRYVHYLRPLPRVRRVEPPGDNVLYRRDCLCSQAMVTGGFWETEVHRSLRARGESLAMADDAVVRFHGGSPPGVVTGQRHRHARHYGAQRSARMGAVERLARVAAAPAVPLVMLRRIRAELTGRGVPLGPWTPALPWLGLLLAAWSAGEAVGAWLGAPTADRHAA
jgi:Glycosyl transferase family 2